MQKFPPEKITTNFFSVHSKTMTASTSLAIRFASAIIQSTTVWYKNTVFWWESGWVDRVIALPHLCFAVSRYSCKFCCLLFLPSSTCSLPFPLLATDLSLFMRINYIILSPFFDEVFNNRNAWSPNSYVYVDHSTIITEMPNEMGDYISRYVAIIPTMCRTI